MYSDEEIINLNKKASEIIKLKYDCDCIKKEGVLIKKLCDFFDYIKDFKLTQTQLRFLYNFANIIGIPQYYEMLVEQNEDLKLNDIHLNDLCSMLYNSSLFMDDNKLFHRYQKEVYENFNSNVSNRYFLTAPTSFGKTFIVTEIIKKMNYKNIVLIFPTISLLAENYVKLLNDSYFDKYKIHTLSDDDFDSDDNNLFIFTPERFLSIMDKTDSLYFDFVFMDEIYKIDNQFIIDDGTIGEYERDLSFRVALQFVCKYSKDILLAGPYIELSNNKNCSMQNFFNDNHFKVLCYNDIEIVNKSILEINSKKQYNFEGLQFNITSKQTKNKLKSLFEALYKNQNYNSIIYTNSKSKAETIAKWMISFKDELEIGLKKQNGEIKDKYCIFLKHIKETFSEEWILYKALSKGIGIHHGYIPKYIQKEIIYFFDVGIIDTIISTTTITEGINTSAKNMIVMSDKKGDKDLKKFDAQNIAGRAGRFMHHYKGFVFSIDNNFNEILNSKAEELKNLEYEKKDTKSEVDIFMSSDKYLTENQRKSKKQLFQRAKSLNLDINIASKFKTIKLSDKIQLYEKISNLPLSTLEKFKNVLDYNNTLNWSNFDLLLETIYDIIDNDDLKNMIHLKTLQNHTILTVKVNSYLSEGFPGILAFEMKRCKVNQAVRNTSKLTFNLFKYHLVKYLGIIDILLKYRMSKIYNCNIEDIKTSIAKLISLLEYNCIDENAKKISDYGVPFKVIKYLNSNDETIRRQFDDYEKQTYFYVKEKFKI